MRGDGGGAGEWAGRVRGESVAMVDEMGDDDEMDDGELAKG